MGRLKFLILFILLLIVGGISYLYLIYQGTSPNRPKDYTKEGKYPPYISSVDYDEDGLDDQSDMLQGALDYVATKPKYKSKYYESGYPDDQYGVCTDVVGHAMRAAGYDIMTLVDKDIRENPEDYDIESPDANIDFRRVVNLDVYFKHQAITLTTDLSKKKQWQGGDIVVFKHHIGIVSDRRNKKGIPYVIHHANPNQTFYEQDILEKRDDIIGHYRISE